VEPKSRLLHVGSFAGFESYHALLLTHLQDLQLRDVAFLGSVGQAELNAIYGSADLFLSMSEHEGFGLPLLESMIYDVPVLAYAGAAVPETLDGAGVLFAEKRFDLISELMGRLARDSLLRQAVIAGQRERIDRYRARDPEAELRRRLGPLLDGGGNAEPGQKGI
jgi:glycosyltransferase involved in cell wall biosynthesis